MRILYLFFGLFFFSIVVPAQTAIISDDSTAIPDDYFEQALIAKGIDSDGTINGWVATDDIDHITYLDVANRRIDDMTGIEDFVALEVLYAGNARHGDVSLNHFYKINLSNNIHLRKIFLGDMLSLRKVNLKNGNNSIITIFNANCFIQGPCDYPLCIAVDNLQMAQNWNGAYSNFVFVDSGHFSNSCSLGIDNKEFIHVKLYPNPVRDRLNVQIDNNLKSLSVFDLSGKRVKQFNNDQGSYDLSSLSPGVYFIKLQTKNSTGIRRVIKK